MLKFSELDLSKYSDGLMPVVVQDDATKTVLMLGYMDEQAYEKSVSERRVTFYSRSKKRLWTKGESSGNFLNIVSVAKDCDSDALLIRVDPVGPTCHTGSYSCFSNDPDEGFVGKLAKIVGNRKKERPEGSYTTKLFDKGVNKIAQKVGEEAVETIIEAMAGNNERLLYEASDLIFHLLVLLENQGVSWKELEKELARRNK